MPSASAVSSTVIVKGGAVRSRRAGFAAGFDSAVPGSGVSSIVFGADLTDSGSAVADSSGGSTASKSKFSWSVAAVRFSFTCVMCRFEGRIGRDFSRFPEKVSVVGDSVLS